MKPGNLRENSQGANSCSANVLKDEKGLHYKIRPFSFEKGLCFYY